MHFTTVIFRSIWLLSSFFLTSNNFVSSFDVLSLLSDILLESPPESFRFRGYDGELSNELHPFFKAVYKLVNGKKSVNQTERTYAFDINLIPQQYLPSGAQLTNKWEIFVPVRNSSRFACAHNFDLYAYIPFANFIPYLKARKRRSVSNAGFQRDREDSQKLILNKRNEKLTFFKAVTETLDQYFGNAKDCILKLICEIFQSPIMEGLLGDFINTIFRATAHDDWSDLSRHFNDDEYDDFIKAEIRGRMGGNCKKFYYKCSKSAFDLLPYVKHNVIKRRR